MKKKEKNIWASLFKICKCGHVKPRCCLTREEVTVWSFAPSKKIPHITLEPKSLGYLSSASTLIVPMYNFYFILYKFSVEFYLHKTKHPRWSSLGHIFAL